jgi:hypothetical protein
MSHQQQKESPTANNQITSEKSKTSKFDFFISSIESHIGNKKYLVRFPPKSCVVIDMDSWRITNGSIKTDSVSSCHFILIKGQQNQQPFAHLYHTSWSFEQQAHDDAAETLASIIKTTVWQMKEPQCSTTDFTTIDVLMNNKKSRTYCWWWCMW